MPSKKDLDALLEGLDTGGAEGLAAAFDRITESAKTTAQYAAMTTEQLQAQTEEEMKLVQASSEYLNNVEKITAEQIAVLKSRKEQYNVARAQYKEALKSGEASKKDLDVAREKVAEAQNLVIQQEKILSAQQSIVGLAQQWSTVLTGASGKLDGMVSAYKELGAAGAAQSFTAGVGDALSVGNILEGMFGRLKESTIGALVKLDDFDAGMYAATQTSHDFYNEALDLQNVIFEQGIMLDSTEAAFSQLHNTLNAFSTVTSAAGTGTAGFRSEAATLAAQLNELNVPIDSTSQALGLMINVMGISGPEAVTSMTNEVVAMGQSLNISAEQSTQMFNRVGPRMAQFGRDGFDNFRRLSVQAQASGVAIEELVGVSQMFDTFDSAATAVGSLNAALGGDYFSTMEMVMASDAERTEIIKKQMQESGYLEMSVQRRRGIAQMLQMDVAQLDAITRSETQALEQNTQSAVANMEATGGLAAQADRATTASQDLQASMENSDMQFQRNNLENYRAGVEMVADHWGRFNSLQIALVLGGIGLAVGLLARKLSRMLFGSLGKAALGGADLKLSLDGVSASLGNIERAAVAIARTFDSTFDASLTTTDAKVNKLNLDLKGLDGQINKVKVDAGTASPVVSGMGNASKVAGDKAKIGAAGVGAMSIAMGALMGALIIVPVLIDIANAMRDMSGPMKVLTTLALTLAIAFGIFWAVTTMGTGLPVILGSTAAAIGGISAAYAGWTMPPTAGARSGVDNYGGQGGLFVGESNDGSMEYLPPARAKGTTVVNNANIERSLMVASMLGEFLDQISNGAVSQSSSAAAAGGSKSSGGNTYVLKLREKVLAEFNDDWLENNPALVNAKVG